MGAFLGAAAACAVTPPIKLGRVVQKTWFIGWQSMAVVCLTGAFTGMVLGLQGYHTLKRVGSEAFLGPLVALSLIRELGPVISALMVTGRAGSAVTAEIGVMRITDQIDAIELMGLNPRRYLVVPSLWAAIISLPLLGAVFDLIGIYGGYLVGVKVLGLGAGTYFGEITTYVDMEDILGGLYKSLSFGVIIAWVCCYKGYFAGFGAEGVSRATTEAVVTSSVLILVWDYFMTAAIF
jgi:phospholipid/cholesterol/gamma-HCH transport system permease protein